MKKYIKPKEVSEFLGVLVKTLQRWDDLVNQKSFLLNYCAGKGVIVDEKL
ncbi:MAG: hypothetical protein ACRCZ2_00475 [Fusobacteriaceae bacterium]